MHRLVRGCQKLNWSMSFGLCLALLLPTVSAFSAVQSPSTQPPSGGFVIPQPESLPAKSPFVPLDARQAHSILLMEAQDGFRKVYLTGLAADAKRRLVFTAWHSLAPLLPVLSPDGDADGPVSIRLQALPYPRDTETKSQPAELFLLAEKQLQKQAGVAARIVYVEPWRDLAIVQLADWPAELSPFSLPKADISLPRELNLRGQPYARSMVWQNLPGQQPARQNVAWNWPGGQIVLGQMLTIEVPELPGAGFSGSAVCDSEGLLHGMVLAEQADKDKKRVFALPAETLTRTLDYCQRWLDWLEKRKQQQTKG